MCDLLYMALDPKIDTATLAFIKFDIRHRALIVMCDMRAKTVVFYLSNRKFSLCQFP